MNTNNDRNYLKTQLGITQDEDPFVAFEKNPCARTLAHIGKRMQTPEMVRRAIENDSNEVDGIAKPFPSPILKYVSKKLLTPELCLLALKKNGRNIHCVPEEWRDSSMYIAAVSNCSFLLEVLPDEVKDYEVCESAVRNDLSIKESQCALKNVPANLLKGEKGRRLCEIAVKSNGLAISHVPHNYITDEIARNAIVNSITRGYIILDTIIERDARDSGMKLLRTDADFWNIIESDWPIGRIPRKCDWPIGYIPGKFMSQELVDMSVEMFPASLLYVPLEYVSEELCLNVVKRNGLHLEDVPQEYRQREAIIDAALSNSPLALKYVPNEKRTKARCLNAIKRDPNVSISWFPDEIYAEYKASIGGDDSSPIIVSEVPIKLNTPEVPTKNSITVLDKDRVIVHDSALEESTLVKTVYYVSDIHLEHQLDLYEKNLDEVKKLVNKKVSELVSSVPDNEHDILLIAGDVADSVELEHIFYDSLRSLWRGRMIAILGNHELWDGNPTGVKKSRPIDKIIDDYREIIQNRYNTVLLENELLIVHKGQEIVTLDEKTLLEADTAELSQLCKESSFIILGGIAFSGLNPRYNASMGLYRSAVSIEDDIERSNRFRAVYDKVLACAASQHVIILTHTPMSDWSNDKYNPSWIYVSGHTHQNALVRLDDGTTVLSDNQIGYKPKRWHLNGFTVRGRYDPFEDWADGIYSITRQQYADFNRGHGIYMKEFKQPGEIFVLKCAGIYMFVLQGKRLYLLAGGQIRVLEHDIDYYYNNMRLYYQQVKTSFTPYRSALEIISNEVQAFGGRGSIHGCIVDIDFYNHIYLNPYDGKIVPYFALDMTNKIIFKDIATLLATSPVPPKSLEGSLLLEQYKLARSNGLTPILASRSDNANMTLATVPEIVLDRSMYEPSRIMRSIQYIFDQNVIRIWKDSILSTCFEDNTLSFNSTASSVVIRSSM